MKTLLVDTISAGDLLGWSWMFLPYVWYFTARALEPTSALFFHGTILRQYCERDHSLGFELLKRAAAVMSRRMQRARDRMLAVHSGRVSRERAQGLVAPAELCAGRRIADHDFFD